jgi:hypothetical protein
MGLELEVGGDIGGTSMIENLTIVSGNITASSSSDGSDYRHGSSIGTECGDSNGTSMIVNFMIMSGNITVSSSWNGSGIETGCSINGGISMIETL